jgi:23S rRNA (cytidine1920-2'-O)/16S rRNA (cytidine1409-2'-O)-methyltransferase
MLLVDRGLVETREKAQALIIAGSVLVNSQPATKPGMGVADDAAAPERSAASYVAGRRKLEGAIRSSELKCGGKFV